MKATVLFVNPGKFRLVQVENQGVTEIKYESFVGEDLLGIEAWKTLEDIPDIFATIQAMTKVFIKRVPKVLWYDGDTRIVLKEDYTLVAESRNTNNMHETFWAKQSFGGSGVGENLAYTILMALLSQYTPKDVK